MNDAEKVHFFDTAQLPVINQERTLLIEESFSYAKEHSFQNDFSPLYHAEFSPSAYCIFHEEKLIAHIGITKRKLKTLQRELNAIFIGGIAIAKDFRGKGFLRLLLEELFQQSDRETDFYFLWSNQNELYERYGFTEQGSIFQTGHSDWNADQLSPLHALSHEQKDIIKSLYRSSWVNRIDRTEEQWEQLFKTQNVTVFLEQDESAYGFVSKGFDLNGIMHEFGAKDLDSFINRYHDKKIWSPRLHPLAVQRLWLAMIRPSAKKKHEIDFNAMELMIGGLDSI